MKFTGNKYERVTDTTETDWKEFLEACTKGHTDMD